MLEVADGDRHASDLLTQSVVKVARDACPFGLLRGHQPSRQLPCAAIAGTKGRFVRSSRSSARRRRDRWASIRAMSATYSTISTLRGGDQEAMTLLLKEPGHAMKGKAAGDIATRAERAAMSQSAFRTASSRSELVPRLDRWA
jgi:hypothetical protein